MTFIDQNLIDGEKSYRAMARQQVSFRMLHRKRRRFAINVTPRRYSASSAWPSQWGGTQSRTDTTEPYGPSNSLLGELITNSRLLR